MVKWIKDQVGKLTKKSNEAEVNIRDQIDKIQSRINQYCRYNGQNTVLVSDTFIGVTDYLEWLNLRFFGFGRITFIGETVIVDMYVENSRTDAGYETVESRFQPNKKVQWFHDGNEICIWDHLLTLAQVV